MDQPTVAAFRHIQRMEQRIERQSALIAELRRSGKDTVEAVNRLTLLRLAQISVVITLSAPGAVFRPSHVSGSYMSFRPKAIVRCRDGARPVAPLLPVARACWR